MKLFSLLALGAALATAAVSPQLQKVNRVYILSMGGGMDQFLANELTKLHVFEVVTDPQKADAVLTDHVGQAFESQLNDLYPPPKPPVAAKDAGKKDADKTDDEKSADDGKTAPKDQLGDVDLSGFSHTSSFGRGRGNFFIVDRGTRAVLWSVYERPKDNTPAQLDKTAEKVVKHLKNDMTDKSEKKPAE